MLLLVESRIESQLLPLECAVVLVEFEKRWCHGVFADLSIDSDRWQ